MSRRYAAWFLVGARFLFACSDDNDAVASSNKSGSHANHALDAGSDAAQQPDAAMSEPTAASSTDPFEPPPNSSFETARAIEPDADTMQRVVNDKQVDYYSFEAEAGVFYVLSTDVSRFSPNNVLTVFDPERTSIAENDDGSLYPGDHIDARVVLRPEHSGTYYVTVEDRTAMGGDEEGHFIPPPFYKLSLREITTTTEGYALEEDDHSPTALRLLEDAVTKTRYITLLGDLGDDDNADTFEIHGLPDKALIGQLLAAGDHGDSSTASTVGVRVTAGSDGHLLAACGLSTGQTNFHPPVDDASYKVQISAGDHVGSNGFYAVDLVLLTDNPHERAEGDNNDIGSAEPIMFSMASSRRGLLLSRLPADDVDFYSFTAEAGELAAVHCEGESGGSGVRGLQADVLSPSMQQLARAHEASTKPLAIEPFQLETSGTHYLKLSSKTPPASPDDVEPWVRCAVVIGK